MQKKSNSPYALSLAAIADPNDLVGTLRRLRELDEADIRFTHDRTWKALAHLVSGKISAASLKSQYDALPKVSGGNQRLRNCAIALCELGEAHALEIRRFEDVKGKRIPTREVLDWGPDLRVIVKANCWYVDKNGVATILILQPRSRPLTPEQLAVYAELASLAYCKGDFVDAKIQIIDMSGNPKKVKARLIDMEDLPRVDEQLVQRYVQTFRQAKALLPEKAKKPSKPVTLPMDEYFVS